MLNVRLLPPALPLSIVLLACVTATFARAAEDLAGVAENPAQVFARDVQPFLKEHCLRCHNVEKATSGVRLDQLDSSFPDRHLKLWTRVEEQLSLEAMPPEDERQPADADRRRLVRWIERSLEAARSRPQPKNGLVRRLTVSQYRNTLAELLDLEDDLTDQLPPDAVSRDGFVNNRDTLQMSPLLVEAYFRIAEAALERTLVDEGTRPAVQAFRVDFGRAINPKPCPDQLILGANSLLLPSSDFVVSEPTPEKPFVFEHSRMRNHYRFIEGYQGNATVRGWREYNSLDHAVFACLRGSPGYPKGQAYGTVGEGLLLRPAIPADGLFTYGPKANFKISLRELPDGGRFRIKVTAAKYDDGLLLDAGTRSQPSETPPALVCRDPQGGQTIDVPKTGVYQVDIYTQRKRTPRPDALRLAEALVGVWPLNGNAAAEPDRAELAGRLHPATRFVASPFGKSVSLDAEGITVGRREPLDIGKGDFTIAAWIRPRRIQQGGLLSCGETHDYQWAHGWCLELADNQGSLRLKTAGPDNRSDGGAASLAGAVRAGVWQHVAAVARRGEQAELYVNGYLVRRGKIGSADLDNSRANLLIGRTSGGSSFRGEMSHVRLYRRALDEAELQALLEPGRQFVPANGKPYDVTLRLADREFAGLLRQPAFLAVRLEAGPLPVRVQYAGPAGIERMVLTPLACNELVARAFERFEKRSPQLGVHLGLRRDCGSTLDRVGSPQPVSSTKLSSFVFTGAIDNFPSPDVEKDNVNYLAGIREIGVRSEYTDGRDMPRLLVRSIEFEGPFYETWPPASHRKILFETTASSQSPAYAHEVIRRFAERAFRRKTSREEDAALTAVFDKSLAEGRGFRRSVQDALAVALTSPQFLLLIERSNTAAAEPLDEDELASKLSYFLWNGPPDDRLRQLADAGRLRSSLDAELDRMVGDPRFSRFVREFVSGWLNLERFDVLEPDQDHFPDLTPHVREQLRAEPVQFVEHLFRRNLPVRNLVDSDFIVANETVAEYYGLADKTEGGFAFVPLRHTRPELGGVLTQAAILAGLSDGRESNPVKRGAWLARRMIAEPPDDPPPNVPALENDTRKLTLRERLEQHRNQIGCAQCHSTIDPWGLPLEEFDAGGRLKQHAVDARSTLPDKTVVSGASELKRYLAGDRIDQVAFCVVKHLATYGCGRTPGYNELERLERDALTWKASGYRMQDLLRFVVHSNMFLEK